MITQVLESSAVWGVLLTLAAFGLGVLINKRTGKAIFNPLLLGTAFVIVVLSVLTSPMIHTPPALRPSATCCCPQRSAWQCRCMKNGICCAKIW